MQQMILERDHASRGPQPPESLIRHDAGEPSREPVAIGQIAEMSVGSDIGRLENIFGVSGVPDVAAGQTEQSTIVAAHDQLEGAMVAVLRSGSKLGIGRCHTRRGAHGEMRIAVVGSA